MARGGGGGSRSGGRVGGGSRSGGRISGAGRSSRGFSGSSGRGFSGGGSRPHSPRPPRPGYAPPPPPPGGRYGGGPGYGAPRPRRHSSGGGCLPNILASIIVGVILLIVVFSVIGNSCSMGVIACSSCGHVVRTSEKREKLDSNNIKLSNQWYIDELGWISYERTLKKGLEEFYDETGVQPLLYLVEHGDGWTAAEQEEFANEKYDELFEDECHFLVCYFACENDDPYLVEGDVYYVCGRETKKILDSEGKEIFTANWDYYYEQEDLTIEQFFSRIFSSTGKDLMRGPIHMRYVIIIIVAIVAVVILVVIFVNWWKARTKQKNKEQEDLERMLDKPLETFGDQSLDDLKDKYDDADGNGN